MESTESDTHAALVLQGGRKIVNSQTNVIIAEPRRKLKILALDVATNTGVAIGVAGTIPRVYAVRLKGPKEDRKIAFRNMACHLRDLFVLDKPDLVVIEAPLHPEAQRSADAVLLQWGAVAAAEAMCGVYNIPTVWVDNQKVSVHFVGRGRFPQPNSREKKKLAFIARAKQLRYIAQDCKNDDMADAAGIWDWACAVYAGAIPKELTLFGGR